MYYNASVSGILKMCFGVALCCFVVCVSLLVHSVFVWLLLVLGAQSDEKGTFLKAPGIQELGVFFLELQKLCFCCACQHMLLIWKKLRFRAWLFLQIAPLVFFSFFRTP